MKAQFVVTIEGDWLENGKPVTAAMAEKRLREAAKDGFNFLADRVTVKRQPAQREESESLEVEVERLKARLAILTDPKVICHRGNTISLNCKRSTIDLFVTRAIENKDAESMDPARVAEFWKVIDSAIAAQEKQGGEA